MQLLQQDGGRQVSEPSVMHMHGCGGRGRSKEVTTKEVLSCSMAEEPFHALPKNTTQLVHCKAKEAHSLSQIKLNLARQAGVPLHS